MPRLPGTEDMHYMKTTVINECDHNIVGIADAPGDMLVIISGQKVMNVGKVE